MEAVEKRRQGVIERGGKREEKLKRKRRKGEIDEKEKKYSNRERGRKIVKKENEQIERKRQRKIDNLKKKRQ